MMRKFSTYIYASLSVAVFLLAVGCPLGAKSSLPPGGNAPVAGVRVDVTPLTTSVQLSDTRDFNAVVVNSVDQNVTWSVIGGVNNGSIDISGLYQAPGTMPASTAVKVRATSNAFPTEYGEATVTLVPGQSFGGFPIELQVGNAGNWQAPNVPVTSGVPLPKGLVPSINALRVTTSGGAYVPAQFTVLSTWDDNSVRWLLVDFLANLSGGVISYYLNNGGTGNATGTQLTVITGGGVITVSTGPLEFTVGSSAFRLFQSVKVDRDGDAQVDDECLEPAALTGVVVTEGVTDYTMDKDPADSVVVEESGPMRCCIRAEGRYRSISAGPDKLRWIARIHAYTGQPYVKVVYSIVNREHDGEDNNDIPANEAAQLADHQDADQIRYTLPVRKIAPTDDVQALISGDSGNHTGTLINPGEYGELRQTYVGSHDTTADSGNPQPAGYTGPDGSSDPMTRIYPSGPDADITYVLQGNLTAVSGDRCPGYMQVALANGIDQLRVTAAVRDFWQNFPKQFNIEYAGNMHIDLWPNIGGWPCQMFEGVMKTHDMLFAFEPIAQVDAGTGIVLTNLINDPPCATVHPRHFKTTQVWGNIATTDSAMDDVSRFAAPYRTKVQAYLTQLKLWFSDIVADRDNGNGLAGGHAYSFFNWGDCKSEDVSHSWDNHDWSIAQACFNWYAASRRRDMMLFGDVALRHYRDICVIHSDVGRRYNYTEPSNPGVGPYGATQKGKSRAADNNRQHNMGNFDSGLPNLEGIQGEALAHHYLLTGDRLSLDVLTECYNFTRGTWKRFFDSANGGTDTILTAPLRQVSAALMLAAAYHMATNDVNAKNFAIYVLFKARARQTSTAPHDPTGRGFDDSSGYFQSYIVGHMVEALEYYRWAIQDSTLDNNILEAMSWIISSDAAVWSNGNFGESYGSTVNAGGQNLLLGAGFAGAKRAASGGNWVLDAEDFLDAQLTSLGTSSDVNTRHTTFAQRFRNGPQFLAVFEP
ncbi:MAG: hypothetical protein IT462_12840 [Planctomycetes bacterium]|nr:hypothetical protein [Planctomycetota bacterium]